MAVDKQIVAERIKALRGELSKLKFARTVGVSRALVSGWEDGKYVPKAENLSRLAEVYDANPDWILGLSGDKTRARVPAPPSTPAMQDSDQVTLSQLRAELADLREWIETTLPGLIVRRLRVPRRIAGPASSLSPAHERVSSGDKPSVADEAAKRRRANEEAAAT